MERELVKEFASEELCGEDLAVEELESRIEHNTVQPVACLTHDGNGVCIGPKPGFWQ